MLKFRLVAPLMVGLLTGGCLETLPRAVSVDQLPALPTLRDRNAAVAEAWDRASFDCRSQHKPRGSFCEQLKIEGDFLACSSQQFARSASALRYPALDKIWVWHNCVNTTASLLRDGYYLTRNQIEKRVANCQARLDPEPEFPIRQSGLFAPFLSLVTTGDTAPLPAVLPGDFGLQDSRVALPTCAARFPALVEASPEPRSLAVVLPPPAPVSPPPPPQIVEVFIERAAPASVPEAQQQPQKDDTKSKPKPRARATVNARDVKSTGNPSPIGRSPAASTNLSGTPLMTGACPIPGACGPTVPADAVGKR